MYGAFVNTDSFTVGEFKEVFFGMRIFELAKQTKSMRHYVWSSLESIFRVRGPDMFDGLFRLKLLPYRKPGTTKSTTWSITQVSRLTMWKRARESYK